MIDCPWLIDGEDDNDSNNINNGNDNDANNIKP